MILAVTHLTRMRHPRICVAGVAVNPPTAGHVRPVLPHANLDRRHLLGSGGLFRIGGLVHLPDPVPKPDPPQVEDYWFDPARARYLEQLDPGTFWRMLQRYAKPSLAEIFGAALRKRGTSMTADVGLGAASLGCLALGDPARLYLSDGKLRLQVNDGAGDLDLSVTDLRFYGDDNRTIREPVVNAIAERLRSGGETLLSVGLTRPLPADSPDPKHWLQVNNIYPVSEPLWQAD